MQRLLLASILCVLIVLLAFPTYGQFKDLGPGWGISAGATFGAMDVTQDKPQFLGRAFFRYPITGYLQGELGAAYGQLGGPTYKTDIIPADFRLLLSPFSLKGWNPYLYAGVGALHYKVTKFPPEQTAGAKVNNWTAVIPAGAGLQIALKEGLFLEFSGGYNYAMTKGLNAVTPTKDDAYWHAVGGLTFQGESGSADPDNDGLTNDEEKQFGTDKHNADTDGDGLKDGDEVKKYNTSPTKADTDGDGLKDGEEVLTYLTDPLKADTDGDGLNDGDEITKYKTNPLKADTDGDGLSDGDEVLKYKTDPLKVDTDGDGLSDGDEVLKYKTDPLKADTDGGTVPDGVELKNGTDPLNPTDDVPKLKVGAAIVLEGVTFKTGSADLTPASEKILEPAYESMKAYPDMTVEIRGYTDDKGKKASNVKLSQKRAESVKDWFVKKGIESNRITTKGLGPDNPIDSNKTEAGRAKNRRIEFFRTK